MNKVLSWLLKKITILEVNKEQIKEFSATEEERILEGTDTMHVYQATDESELAVLRRTSEDIDPNARFLQKLAQRMLLTVQSEEHAGVGIAAPQVGINRNLIWVQRFDKKEQPFELFINPKIIWHSNLLRNGTEGCLSIPDRREDVMRSYAIRLAYQNTDGQMIEENIEGFTAVIFQHEVDHLHGILYPDRLEEHATKITVLLNEKMEFSLSENSIFP